MDNLNGRVIVSSSYEPSVNLAMEYYITENIGDDEYVLFLWQNKNTIVIGRNQNPYLECDVSKLEELDTKIIRRPSGGGAVYHDLGNLNFSFITTVANYNLERNLEIIKDALGEFGIESKFTGRNDLTIDGKKFSGNAFFQKEKGMCHHGTLLVNVDATVMSTLLTPAKQKLQSNSISSVKSRVINLQDLDSSLNIETLSKELKVAFEKRVKDIRSDIYGYSKYISSYVEKFESKQWTYYDCPVYSNVVMERFLWGLLHISYEVIDGVISKVSIYTDALEDEKFSELESMLINQKVGMYNINSIVDNCIEDANINVDMKCILQKII